MQFDEVLRTFARFFEREHVRYAVIGGLALQAWGYSRFTRDVDIVVERAVRDRVVSFVESLGYETPHVSEGYSNHLHSDASYGRVDFMYVDADTASKLFPETTVKAIVGDFAAPVPKPEHLLAMKAISMKNSPHRVLIDSPDVQKDSRELVNFLPGVGTTPADAAALQAVRDLDRLDPVQYLAFLRLYAPQHRPSREIPERHEPFTL